MSRRGPESTCSRSTRTRWTIRATWPIPRIAATSARPSSGPCSSACAPSVGSRRSSTARTRTISPIIVRGRRPPRNSGSARRSRSSASPRATFASSPARAAFPRGRSPRRRVSRRAFHTAHRSPSPRLSAIERAERALQELGVTGNLRVRHHGDTARVEMDLAQLEHWQRADRAAELCRRGARGGIRERRARSARLPLRIAERACGRRRRPRRQCASFWHLSWARGSAGRFARRPRQ